MKRAIALIISFLMLLSFSSCSEDNTKETLTAFFAFVYDSPNEEIAEAMNNMQNSAMRMGSGAEEMRTPNPQEYLNAFQPFYSLFDQYIAAAYMDDFIMKNLVSIHNLDGTEGVTSHLLSLEIEERENNMEYERTYLFSIDIECADAADEGAIFTITGSLRLDEENKITNLVYHNNYDEFQRYVMMSIEVYPGVPVFGPVKEVPIHINIIASSQLELFVGKTVAAAIIKHRDEHGDFESIDDLRGVPGMTEEAMEELEFLDSFDDIIF